MIEWLHDLPLPLGAAVVCIVFLVPTVIGSLVLQPAVANLLRGEKSANTLVGLLLNSYTLFYGVLLALLSISVYENYNSAQEAVGREASSLFALYRNVRAYPEPIRSTLIEDLRRYVDEETGPGWQEQRRDRMSQPGMHLVDRLGDELLRHTPNRYTGEYLLHAQTLRAFDEFIDRRRARIQAAGTNIPRILWYVVIVGAVLNVFVLWLFDLKRTTHLIFGGVLMAFIGLVIYMVAVLDRPFRGGHGLKPADLVHARQQMDE